MSGVRFAPFTTIGPYFFMGGGSGLPCAPGEAYTDEVLAEISIFGGAIEKVDETETSLVALNNSMSLWWLLAEMRFQVSASGTYKFQPPGSPPPPEIDLPWSFNQEIIYPGVLSPNSASGKPINNPNFRILDCPQQDRVVYRDQSSQYFDGQIFDNYTHLFPFYGDNPNDPRFMLAEFFSVIEPLAPPATTTNSALLIISSRNKSYTDVIIEGSLGASGPDTYLYKSTNITIQFSSGNVEFLAQLFVTNSNLSGFSINQFDIEFISKSDHIRG